jgi:dolichyl-phosphate-mannose--protein O-mannosyl transferase
VTPDLEPVQDFSLELTSIHQKFRLRHQATGCYLFSHKVMLPEWGFGQQEVLCNKESPVWGSVWFVESNEHGLSKFSTFEIWEETETVDNLLISRS